MDGEDAKYKSESLKFWNREAQAVKNQNLAAKGLVEPSVMTIKMLYMFKVKHEKL